ncbi:MAG: aldehyde dehydrogenase family protein, partial [Rhodospirillaceae bacterium]|nr:aldehyde dehydrogenase family protein [Rhodospirillaceae bacterium]
MSDRDLRAFFIGGEWVQPDSTAEFPVFNPASEARIGTIMLGNEADVNRAVAAAAAAFEGYSRTTKAERLTLLNRLLKESAARLEDLARAMTAEMGAPITMSREAQADAAVGHLKAFIEALEKQEARETLPNGEILVREPIGVCGLITPWNWPIYQIALKVIP